MRKLKAPPPFPYGRVERVWAGETVVCMASGPSMTQADADYVRGKARVIVINTTYQLAPWADVLYACDERWWRWHKGAKDFQGMKFALTKLSATWGVTVLRNTGASGLEHDPTGLKNGRNSGYQAMNLAVHFGVKKIILLGYDMMPGKDGRAHWHKDHPVKLASSYRHFRKQFETLVAPLAKVNVEVVNCTRKTALECFPCAPLESVFGSRETPAGSEPPFNRPAGAVSRPGESLAPILVYGDGL